LFHEKVQVLLPARAGALYATAMALSGFGLDHLLQSASTLTVPVPLMRMERMMTSYHRL
jgi:hypothetical protein